MSRTDETLMHAFYAGETSALDDLATRYDTMFTRIVYLILFARTASETQALSEWDIDDRVNSVWAHILNTRTAGLARWPHQRLTVLTWLLHLLSLEMDRHLGFRPPF
jgi:hypothetical protein